MEDRLARLRISMLEEKKKRDAELPAKHGGNRWRSAREDRGSVSRYAQDVQNKAKPMSSSRTKRTGSAASDRDTDSVDTSSTKKGTKKRAQRNVDAQVRSSPLGILSVATVATWTPAQVLEWLSSIGLEEYQPVFEYHQVTGAALLALTLSEYTQMGIMKLSTRNTLYTSIEKIREQSAAAMATANGSTAASQSPQQLQQQQRRNPPPTDIIDAKLRDVQPEVQASNGSIHWSRLTPLADTAVASGGNSEVPVNLADGEFNEDASHASFMKALLEWRSCDSESAAENGAAADGNSAKKDDMFWVNPMTSMFGNDDNNDGNSGLQQTGGALLDGSYDEEKEQEAFRRAVAAWRTGASGFDSGAASSQSPPEPASVEQIEQGCPAAQHKSCWQCYRVVTTDCS